MTRRLILIRHAKSAWDDPEADDHARVLNERGRASATAIGTWLAETGIVPDQVLSSDSARTLETWERIAAELSDPPEAMAIPALYHADPETMFAVLEQASGDCVLMLAHNPGIGILARWLAEDGPDHPRFRDYPTCATTVFDFPVDHWRDVQGGTGVVVDFVVPRDLED
ncbi:SixA phosphatase family protein [Pelagovum pacificum]|uniref:Histidine phosphatase family protein n=1 Tax=Pelagovum pacificum TaxID=2588711 RepID=A0A5C5GFF7_9RHOB|nr:histidine phosphatase family protein [Pelagovum pacificum]QQA43365.1 histidine phosphatase family protein [Pelagovum pacificum]TNY33498.1 histidine phosphatase family protein [Pelagovum pacificum]